MINFKDTKVLLTASLIASWVIMGTTGVLLYTSNSKKMEIKDAEIVRLDSSLREVGELVNAYTVIADVPSGKLIEETDLVELQVPVSLTSNLLLDQSELVGNRYKVDVTPGTPLSTDLVTPYEITDDLRLFDVVLDNVPVGLEVDSYVDVRISLPLGEDFIALSHKQVKAINAGVLKLAITEEDIHVYNSMLIDSFLYEGTQLYAVEYVEGGVQRAADAYYPMSKNVLAIAQKDPNLLSAIKSDMLQRRDVLEAGLANVTPSEDEGRESIDKILSRGKEQYASLIAEAERAYQIEVERQAELED